jgi:hypothetical protein
MNPQYGAGRPMRDREMQIMVAQLPDGYEFVERGCRFVGLLVYPHSNSELLKGKSR